MRSPQYVHDYALQSLEGDQSLRAESSVIPCCWRRADPAAGASANLIVCTVHQHALMLPGRLRAVAASCLHVSMACTLNVTA